MLQVAEEEEAEAERQRVVAANAQRAQQHREQAEAEQHRVVRVFLSWPMARTLRINIYRAGRNRMYAPYTTVYWVNSLPKIPYVYRIYMVLANPKYI